MLPNVQTWLVIIHSRSVLLGGAKVGSSPGRSYSVKMSICIPGIQPNKNQILIAINFLNLTKTHLIITFNTKLCTKLYVLRFTFCYFVRIYDFGPVMLNGIYYRNWFVIHITETITLWSSYVRCYSKFIMLDSKCVFKIISLRFTVTSLKHLMGLLIWNFIL